MKDKIDTGLNGDLTCESHSAISRLSDSLAPTRRRHERWPDEEREVVNEKVYGSNRTNKFPPPADGFSLAVYLLLKRRNLSKYFVE
ncbi:transposase [Novosphingobium sp. PY1]|nr:transposase [Novosphingobium sp. PY1]